MLSFTWQRSRIAVASLSAADLQAEGAGGVFSPTPGTEGPGATPTYSLDFFVNFLFSSFSFICPAIFWLLNPRIRRAVDLAGYQMVSFL